MIARPFICTPSEWVMDRTLNALSDDAELLFRRLASCTDSKWRFVFSPDELIHDVRTAAFRPKRRFRAWNPDRVRRSLNELTAAGMLTRHCHDDRHWLEVAPRWRYEKGRDPFGDPPPGGGKHPELAMGPLGVVRAEGENGMRVEKNESKAPESARDPEAGPAPRSQDSGTRAQGRREGDSARFARWIEDVPDDSLWRRLCQAVGKKEMALNGAMWLKRLHDHRDALATAVSDFEALPDRARIPAARWITGAFTHLTQRAA